MGSYLVDLAALDRLNDDELWRIARSQRSEIDSQRLHDLLEKNAEGMLTPNEQIELNAEVNEADRFILYKAHSAAQLQQFIDRAVNSQTNDREANHQSF